MTASLSTALSWRSWFLLSCSALLLVLALPVHAATSTPETLDTDGDGLLDILETKFGTDPNRKDTDGDSFEDGLEILMAYSPTNTQPIQLEKTIHIKIKTQTLEKRVGGIAVKSFKVSTGLPRTPTPIGEFKVLNKIPRAWSRSAKLWMPNWMAFSWKGYGVHELPEWPGGKKEGANHLGHRASHGCVRLGIGAAKELFDWAPVGTRITITN